MSTPDTLRIEGHAAIVGDGMPINRVLPSRLRRLVGPWCFLDHIGPAAIGKVGPLRVGPHPHIGLQTVTWLTAGEILHRDSLGSLQMIRAGQLNVMTSGRAISHSEESPSASAGEIHGVQFWTVLPDAARFMEPMFDHYAVLPKIERENLSITVISGEYDGARSPARHFWPIVGLEITAGVVDTTLNLNPAFEHALLVIEGEANIDGEALLPNVMLYLGAGRERIQLGCSASCRIILIGGKPFEEEILMWWNFVGRTREELTQACVQWNAGEGGFGDVHGYDGKRLTAPMPPWASTPG
jgi:redox-sensitive bicupin YhaK (pirin superfamily)